MRIAFVSVSGQLGGSETVLLHLLRELPMVRPEWTRHVVALADGPLVERVRGLGADVHVIPMPPGLAAIGDSGGRGRLVGVSKGLASAAIELPAYTSDFGRTLRRVAPDVVHSNGLKAHVLTARAGVQARRLWHLHDYLSPRPLSRRLLRHYAPRCDAWVANSASVAADARAVIGTRDGRVEAVVPNGVDLASFGRDVAPADLDALAGLPPGEPGLLRVGLVATFARWKGHEVLLRALGDLPRRLPVRGYIIGGPLYDTRGSQYSLSELRVCARAAGCESRIGFTGFQTDMPAVLSALDIVVHASTEPEPFGLVLLEAMAAGRPLITTALGGASEIVTPGVDALVHRAGDPESLARAIGELAADPERRRQLAAAGRTKAAAYDVRQVAEQFAAIYERVVNR